MNETTKIRGRFRLGSRGLVLAACVCILCSRGFGQDTRDSAPTKADAEVVGDEGPAPTLAPAKTLAERSEQAWTLLSNAAHDAKKPQTRIQALAALGLLRDARAEKMITSAMADPDMDVRTAAALAAGETKDRNMTTSLRNLLDDKEPQVVYTAAMTLWKMGDKSGEDVLMSVVDGDRSASGSMMHDTEHKISRDLHDPAKLAKLGAIQGAYLLLGPFGYGITAFEYMHQSGGDQARAAAIEQIAQERIEPVHQKLIAALSDKDVAVRAAAAKALVEYHDTATQMAVYSLLGDSKQPVRLTAAAAYLRTAGVPGPPVTASDPSRKSNATKVQTPMPGKAAKVN